MITIVLLKEHRQLLAGVPGVLSVSPTRTLLLAKVRAAAPVELSLRDQNASVLRLLDRFLLVCGDGQDQLARLYTGFFSEIAERYESVIHPRQNVENIRSLLRIARAAPGQDLVLDYGCGTGLAIRAGAALSIGPDQFVGVDACPVMRRQAKLAGMRVLSPGQLRRCTRLTCAAVIASYVFHLPTAATGIEYAWQRLRPHGLLVGNCHKGQGVAEIVAAVKGLGGKRVGVPQEDDRHGVYVGFRK